MDFDANGSPVEIEARASAGADGTLVLFPGALGDAVCLEPALRWLAKRGPVEFWARGGALEVARSFPSAPALGSLDGPEVAGLFAPLNGEASAPTWLRPWSRVVSFTGARSEELRARLAAAGNAAVFPFPRIDGDGHAIDEMLRAVSAGRGELGGVPKLLRAIGPAVAGGLVIHPGSGGTAKRAPRGLFREVAERWVEAGREVRVVLGPAEAAEDGWGEVAAVVRPPSVDRLVNELARAGVYLGNDSGPSHVAAALGVPSVVLFRASRPERFGPRGPGVVWGRPGAWEKGGSRWVYDALEAALP